MADAFVRFEREGIEGLAAVGSRLCDVIKRLGVTSQEGCDPAAESHSCTVSVIAGIDSLSPLTAREREHFASPGRKNYERLACDAVITAAGEITIMTDEKTEDTTNGKKGDPIVSEFEELPLEQKLATLVRMEVVALGETLTFVANSPFKVFEKIGDVMAEFGMKLEAEAKKASRPKPEAATEPDVSSSSSKPKPKKKPVVEKPDADKPQ